MGANHFEAVLTVKAVLTGLSGAIIGHLAIASYSYRINKSYV